MKAVVVGSWHLFAVTLLDFSFTGLFAALVNAGLKFMKKNLHLLWRQTLTEHVHDIYLENRNYYEAAVVLAGQGRCLIYVCCVCC